jgi:hypothetical protein
MTQGKEQIMVMGAALLVGGIGLSVLVLGGIVADKRRVRLAGKRSS